MSIPEAASHFLGWRYARVSSDNRFPVVRDCMPPSLLLSGDDARLIDCSTFVAAVLVYAYADRVEWDATAYADMQIMDASRLWSCVDAWRRHGLGAKVPIEMIRIGGRDVEMVTEPAQGWSVYQGWVDDQPAESDGDSISGGHQWFYNGAMGVRENSTSRGGVGPAWERMEWSTMVGRYKSGIRGVTLA